MNFACDLYVYESNQGYMIHVANCRVIGDIPKVPFVTKDNIEETLTAHKQRQYFLETAEHEKIGLSYDGETFVCCDPEDFHGTLVMLKDAGYLFPFSIIDEVAKEDGQRVDDKTASAVMVEEMSVRAEKPDKK